MLNTGFVVAGRVLPDVPVRQWVLSTPFELRLLLAANAHAFGALTRIFAEEVLTLQQRRASARSAGSARGGLLVFQHRFGGSLNLNTHLHAVVVDGVFTRNPAPAGPSLGETVGRATRAGFLELPAPERVELQDFVFRVYRRFVAWLRRRGLLRIPADDVLDGSARNPSALEACLRGSLGVGRLHTLPDTEEHELPPGAAEPDAKRFALTSSPHAADFGGFGVLAVSVGEVRRGAPVRVSGTVVADGEPCPFARVDVALRGSDDRAVTLGAVPTDAHGRYDAELTVPCSSMWASTTSLRRRRARVRAARVTERRKDSHFWGGTAPTPA